MNRKHWWVVGVISLSLPVNAASLFQPVEISDAELSQLRGRYVLPDRVIHFGVTMSTFWQNNAGQSIGANVTLQVSGQAQPSLHVSYVGQAESGGSAAVPGVGQVIGGNGLAQVQGISQSVRSAGDYNDALNDLSISISNTVESLPTPEGQAWSGSTQFSNEAGSVQITNQSGGLRLALDANGQGLAQQQIGGGNVLQQANINSSLNSVRNLAALNIALRDRPLNMDLANCTWEQLRALRPAGY